MQLTNVLALFALTATGVVAAPAAGGIFVPRPVVTPPKVAPPVINKNGGTITNTCQSGPAYCCSPTGATNSGDKSDGDTKAGTTCQGTAPSTQNCGLASFLAQPVVFKVQE
ncbi:hypothetical protein N0V86_008346 [Didymella sp. IMI 355093]|nr:hypothetical protein N0V86_008346 [Didymella sp. IMI 355093]